MILKRADSRERDIAELERLATEYPVCAAKARQEIANIKKGQQGENSAAHFLNREFGDSRKIGILHDVRFDCGDGNYAQIDHLLINRIQQTAWVLETKNYAGNLRCDEHGDWTVFYGSKPTSIPSPVEQAKRQARALELWLKRRGIKGINRIVPVVLVNPRSHINRKHLREGEYVIKADNFARWLDDQTQSLGAGKVLVMLGQFAVNGMDEAGLQLLGKKISRAHEEASFDWAARMGLSKANDRPIRASGRRVSSKASANVSVGRIPEVIPTSKGDFTIRKIGHYYAVRNPNDPAAIELMKSVCKGRGKWNPRYKNWLVREDDILTVASDLLSKASAL